MLEKILWVWCLFIVLFTEFAWSQSDLPKEISVSAEQEVTAPAQISRFTLVLDGSAEKAVELEKKLNSQLEDLKAALKETTILSSRIEINPETKIGQTTKTGQAFIDCETKGSPALALALDLSHSVNAKLSGKVIYSFSNEQDDAIRLATIAAKHKAEKVATTLGVKLGNLLSAGITEEPLGALILQARQFGGPEDPATLPQRSKVIVQARFAVL